MAGHMGTPLISTAMLLIAGCASLETGDASQGLVGSSWKLVGFQSMDDAQGTSKPSEGKDYSLTFGTDGRASMQLDCNRGSASYQTANDSAEGGSLTFGPVAATRALCTPPDVGETIARRLPDVASYTIRDGRLFLALKMDGGIYEFTRN